MSHLRRLMRAIKTYSEEIETPEGKKITRLVIEGDIDPLLDALAKVAVKRREREQRKHFTVGQHAAFRLGFGGMRAFQSTLNQRRIPYIIQEPSFEWYIHNPPYDFIIPKPSGGVLRLEIKTSRSESDFPFEVKAKLWDIIKKWHGLPDYLIALKELPRIEPDKIKHEIAGWLTGAEFDREKKYAEKGVVRWSKHAACYWCPWDKLHDWKELESKILECAIKVAG